MKKLIYLLLILSLFSQCKKKEAPSSLAQDNFSPWSEGKVTLSNRTIIINKIITEAYDPSSKIIKINFYGLEALNLNDPLPSKEKPSSSTNIFQLRISLETFKIERTIFYINEVSPNNATITSNQLSLGFDLSQVSKGILIATLYKNPNFNNPTEPVTRSDTALSSLEKFHKIRTEEGSLPNTVKGLNVKFAVKIEQLQHYLKENGNKAREKLKTCENTDCFENNMTLDIEEKDCENLETKKNAYGEDELVDYLCFLSLTKYKATQRLENKCSFDFNIDAPVNALEEKKKVTEISEKLFKLSPEALQNNVIFAADSQWSGTLLRRTATASTAFTDKNKEYKFLNEDVLFCRNSNESKELIPYALVLTYFNLTEENKLSEKSIVYKKYFENTVY